jgi:cytochrome P450
VILEVLGLPETDYPRMLRLTQELFGAEDPDLQREPQSPEARERVVEDFFAYFRGLAADRRTTPTDDLATLIANGVVDGQPIGELPMLGYYVIVATAGHDTTSSAMAGGMHLLATHPEVLAQLQNEPELLPNAIEEMLRCTAPVRHFMRTVGEDTEIAGREVAAGDRVYLSYKAANLDPKVFADPLRFDITRANAAKQVSFGHGAHFCLGAQLARNELRSLFGAVVPHLESLELAGPTPMARSTFVGGHKSVPIRYRLRAA